MPALRHLCYFSFALLMSAAAAEKSGHLFILSGQSNMTGGVKQGFTLKVTKYLGEEATIVHHCKPGRGIRFWVKDYQLPEWHPMAGLSRNPSNGEEFHTLVEIAKSAGDARNFKTVHLIWMQGESDANRDLGAAYEASFQRLLDGLKTELGVEQMHFVIGRISDHGLHGKNAAGWKRMRAVQQKLAEEDPLGAWIDTDALNGGDENKPGGQLHYPREQYPVVGIAFADAVLEQLGIESAK